MGLGLSGTVCISRVSRDIYNKYDKTRNDAVWRQEEVGEKGCSGAFNTSWRRRRAVATTTISTTITTTPSSPSSPSSHEFIFPASDMNH
ncbi:hypothetical protein E2C01_046651 [Portunus trituberculatus]|uniref:Uncharacterized protein n=1 Tax=Portunus trituberculatus TaxID=210409 RepID=A0A5B7G6A4_PORTR|nr:hypothetical protein [Portunus trituberculatus]